jgi:hypothetical protein
MTERLNDDIASIKKIKANDRRSGCRCGLSRCKNTVAYTVTTRRRDGCEMVRYLCQQDTARYASKHGISVPGLGAAGGNRKNDAAVFKQRETKQPSGEGENRVSSETEDSSLPPWIAATREGWLQAAIEKLREVFAAKDIALPFELRVACGFPCRGALARNRRLGECHPMKSAVDGVTHILATPWLDDPIEVLTLLVHELIHASDDCESGHRGVFKQRAIALGLEGKMGETHLNTISPELRQSLEEISELLGPYPHRKLDPVVQYKKDSNRLIKVACPACEYTVRTTKKWIDVGLPSCPCGAVMTVRSALEMAA